MSFTCNICGAACERPNAPMGREVATCPQCNSTVRERALIAMVSLEIFGTLLTLPEFPALKGIRAIGMSDSPKLAERLAEKFDYTNTFYHQSPVFDLTHPDERDFGRYDFILSSEVLEHVPPPVEAAFATLARLLKPDGLLLMTTPYSLGGKTVEHYPELYEYTLATPGGRTVLVNRRRDGSLETFEDLVFHGGDGSTLELRVFTEAALRELILGAGFHTLRIASECYPEYGVEHSAPWSLPIAARKGRFVAPPDELAREYREACRLAARTQYDLDVLTAEYDRHIAFHESSHAEMKRELASRLEWAHKLEKDFEERTHWAQTLELEKREAIAAFEHARKSELEAWQCVNALEKDLDETRARKTQLETSKWTRLGRKLGTVR